MKTASTAAASGEAHRLIRLFTDRNISAKIGAGFACVLVITAAISVMAYLAFHRISTSFAELNRIGGIVSAARAIDRGFIDFRRFVREYAISGDEAAAGEAEKRRPALAAIIEDARKRSINPERTAKLKHIGEQFEAYSTDFDKLLKLRREQSKLTKEVLDPTGLKLRTDIEQLQAWSARKAGNNDTVMLAVDAFKQLMLARLNVNKLLGRHEESAAQAADKAFADLKSAMAALGLAIEGEDVRRLFMETNSNVDKYLDAYKKAAHDAHEIDSLVNGGMARGASGIAIDSSAIVETGVADEKRIDLETETLIASVERQVLLLAAGGLMLGAIMAWLISRGIARPIRGMTYAMSALAGGDHDVVVPAQHNKDEIGEMAKAVLVFRDAAVEKVRIERKVGEQRERAEKERMIRETEKAEEAKQAQATIAGLAHGLGQLAHGDLLCQIESPFAPNAEQLRKDFNSAVEKLRESMVAVVTSAGAITSGTQEIATASNDLSRRTEQQASSLEETAAALDQITATVKKAAEGATHARKVVAGTKEDAERSGEVVRKAVEAMGGIEKSSQQISQIIGVIDEIAFQTNLLALNAGVEAARAGDAGRGFAVVASEVRALAQRSAEAAKEIKGLILTSTGQVEQGVQLVAETGKSLERIVTKVAEINAVVTDIASGAQEQATGLQQVNTAVNQMDKVTQQNAAMAEQATAASRSLAQESTELANLVSRFRVSGGGKAEPAPRTAAKVHPVRLASRSAEPAKEEAAPRRQMKSLAGRNGSAAARKADPIEDADGWQDF